MMMSASSEPRDLAPLLSPSATPGCVPSSSRPAMMDPPREPPGAQEHIGLFGYKPWRTTLIAEEEINGQGLKRAQPPTRSGAQMSAVRTALPWSAFADASLIRSSG